MMTWQLKVKHGSRGFYSAGNAVDMMVCRDFTHDNVLYHAPKLEAAAQ
jgi:hypothetical protein